MFLKKLDKNVLAGLEEAGLEQANDFQKKSIARIKSGGDLVAIAPDGVGKSTALVVAIVQQLKREINDIPRAIVCVENNEKADALKAMFDAIGKHTSLRVHAVYERMPLDKQQDKIYFGADVVIGNPLVLGKLYAGCGLNLSELKIIAFDDSFAVFRDKNMATIAHLTQVMPKAQRVIFATNTNDRMNRYIEGYMEFPAVIEGEGE